MKQKLYSLLNDSRDLMKKVLERNVLIILLSTVVFVFLFFTENGIIHQYYLYNRKKYTLNQEIAQKKQQLAILNKKIQGLNNRNPDIMEEVLYLYQNKDPYSNKTKTIVLIKESNKKQ